MAQSSSEPEPEDHGGVEAADQSGRELALLDTILLFKLSIIERKSVSSGIELRIDVQKPYSKINQHMG